MELWKCKNTYKDATVYDKAICFLRVSDDDHNFNISISTWKHGNTE